MAPLARAGLYVKRLGCFDLSPQPASRLGRCGSQGARADTIRSAAQRRKLERGMGGTSAVNRAVARCWQACCPDKRPFPSYGQGTRQAPPASLRVGERLAGVTTLPSLGQRRESGPVKSPMRSEPAQTSRQGAPEREVFQSVFPRRQWNPPAIWWRQPHAPPPSETPACFTRLTGTFNEFRRQSSRRGPKP